MPRKYNSTYKKNRSKKPMTLDEAELRLTDCIKKLEEAILSENVDRERVQTLKASTYAISNAINRLVEVKEVKDLKAEIDELREIIENDD